MSIRPPSSTDLPKVQAPKTESTPGGWQPIPHINQLRPGGAEVSYANGVYNCAPTVVAMLARGAGKKSELSDAQLITELGKGIITADGTTAEGLAKMLGRAGLPINGKALAGNYSDAAVKQHLQQGNKLIAQVALTDAAQKNASGHYVLIREVTAQGNYVISDPMSAKAVVVTPEQLRDAVNRAPPDGGLLLPVATSATNPLGPGPLASKPISHPKPSLDVFSHAPSSPHRPGCAPAAPAPTASQGTPGSAPALNAATLASTSNPSSLLDPAAALAQPDASAFSVSAAAFEGVNTDFQAAAPAERQRLSRSELRNVTVLDIDYGAPGSTLSPHTAITPVIGKEQSAQEAVQDLRQRKQNNDPTVDPILEQLEASIAPKDRLVLLLYKQAELRDPGIGKKTWTDSM